MDGKETSILEISIQIRSKHLTIFWIRTSLPIINYIFPFKFLKTVTSHRLLGADSYVNFINANRNFSDDFFQWPLDNTDEDALEKATQRVVSLSVYYESFAYTMSEESPKTDIVSMFASMGGSLSLFLGVSLFSLFEVVDVFVEIFNVIQKKNKSRKMNESKANVSRIYFT
jgi:hypothetical protein